MFQRPMNEKRSYYEFGKFISERAKSGTVRDALNDLAEALKGTSLSAPSEGTASKLRKVYELYVERYGFSMDELEEVSALDLFRAQSNAFEMVNNKADAQKLVKRLKAGEKFRHICREYENVVQNDPVLKTKPEYLMEEIYFYSSRLNVDAEESIKLRRVVNLAKKYLELIRVQRVNPSEAERLFIKYNQEVIKLYLLQ